MVDNLPIILLPKVIHVVFKVRTFVLKVFDYIMHLFKWELLYRFQIMDSESCLFEVAHRLKKRLVIFFSKNIFNKW
jgi:hypothetical protein